MKLVTHAFKQTLRYTFFGLLALTLIASCKKQELAPLENQDDFDIATAPQINFFNASPDAGATKLYIDSTLRTPNAVNPGEFSGYYKTKPGKFDFVIKSSISGKTLTLTGKPMEPNKRYTVVLASNAKGGYSGYTFADELPASGKAIVRFLSSASVNSEIFVTSPGGINARIFPNQPFSTPNEYAAGTYNLQVSASGKVLTTKSVILESGKIYTIFSKGKIDGTGIDTLSLNVYTSE